MESRHPAPALYHGLRNQGPHGPYLHAPQVLFPGITSHVCYLHHRLAAARCSQGSPQLLRGYVSDRVQQWQAIHHCITIVVRNAILTFLQKRLDHSKERDEKVFQVKHVILLSRESLHHLWLVHNLHLKAR